MKRYILVGGIQIEIDDAEFARGETLLHGDAPCERCKKSIKETGQIILAVIVLMVQCYRDKGGCGLVYKLRGAED